ncbi:MAG: hypothetical protein UR28_C0001G0096 [Candidatus Peregrinibacteria bacterium GW2011_GWF2_33_10]|nr:MAG: hypothetical protein UR28_C0001G0096 [Candidatus Peregrinibacteria bacterium GW2011_GWF2_33_10]OGJ44838.1 MAG: hypothetical protein A2263_06405 [Candidatus Peregrinibacteria bacterium RIFOXYA2_FULL_33_21]OGJ47124.1 MAG: hypothetical protein A2272_03125 [Candidatus Peregrinibacteria bacterium RIFOXYA12_FULL_33_12]OGJ50524.1 MAG: hypothetical protein A2307_03030 [Candidatus Peregrinibacteria bacterium RIFOXYB2_FULL_33_20]
MRSKLDDQSFVPDSLIKQYFSDALTPSELSKVNRFIVINGISIEINDLINALYGREFQPQLDMQEISSLVSPEGNIAEYDAYKQFQKTRSFFTYHTDQIKSNIRKFRSKKRKKIEKIIKSAATKDISKLLKREQILMMLSRGRLYYNSLTEFLTQFAELTEEGAECVAQTVKETRDEIMQTRQATPDSKAPLFNMLQPDVFYRLANLLRIRNSRELKSVPSIIFERVLIGHGLSNDDLQQLQTNQQVAIKVPFDLEVGTGFMTAAFTIVITLAYGILIHGVGDPIFETMLIASLPIMVSGFSMAAISSHTGWTPITNLIRKSQYREAINTANAEYQKLIEQLSAIVNRLQTNATGNLRLVLAREILTQALGTNDSNPQNIEILSNELNRIMSNEEIQNQFEEFCLNRRGEFDSISSTITLLNNFKTYERSKAEVESSVKQSQDHQSEPPTHPGIASQMKLRH